MNFIDFLYIFFATLVLYFTFIFLILFSRNKKDFSKVPKIKKLPSVSIIVPAYNEEKNIGSVIKNLKKLKYPKKLLEIIVVDDGSTDKTAEIAEKNGAKVIRKEKGGKASALNIGLKHAKSEIIACIDADSYPKKNALIEAVPFFVDKDVAAVTTRIFTKKKNKILEKFQSIEYAMIAWSRKLFEYIEGVYVTPGPLSLYRKSVVEKIGGFDEKNLTEDIEIAWRILSNGYKIKMSPAKTYTEIPRSFKKWWKQRLRWNIGGIQTFIKYRKSMFKKGSESFGFFIVPFFALSYFLSLLALSIFLYLIYIWAFNNILFYISAYSVGLNPIKRVSQLFMPDLFTIFGVLIFILSIVIVNTGLKTMGYQRNFKTWFYILLYLTIYITIFPLILVHSLIKMAKGYKEW
ncbi:MAG: glycosyltransferase family 2 protein [Candidatus Aenigmatarchaeota archaeon]